jgi:hypothetical protein
MKLLIFGTRRAWQLGFGKFYGRRCGFSSDYRVPARYGPSHGTEDFPGLEAWVPDLSQEEVTAVEAFRRSRLT